LSIAFAADVRALEIEGVARRHQADGRLLRFAVTFGALEDPLEDAEVVAEARPEELAAVAGAEPVGAEDRRRMLELRAHFQPMREVVAEV